MALTASKGWDDLGTSWRQFCFQQLTTDLSRDPGDMRLGRVHDANACWAVAIAPDSEILRQAGQLPKLPAADLEVKQGGLADENAAVIAGWLTPPAPPRPGQRTDAPSRAPSPPDAPLRQPPSEHPHQSPSRPTQYQSPPPHPPAAVTRPCARRSEVALWTL